MTQPAVAEPVVFDVNEFDDPATRMVVQMYNHTVLELHMLRQQVQSMYLVFEQFQQMMPGNGKLSLPGMLLRR